LVSESKEEFVTRRTFREISLKLQGFPPESLSEQNKGGFGASLLPPDDKMVNVDYLNLEEDFDQVLSGAVKFVTAAAAEMELEFGPPKLKKGMLVGRIRCLRYSRPGTTISPAEVRRLRAVPFELQINIDGSLLLSVATDQPKVLAPGTEGRIELESKVPDGSVILFEVSTGDLDHALELWYS